MVGALGTQLLHGVHTAVLASVLSVFLHELSTLAQVQYTTSRSSIMKNAVLSAVLHRQGRCGERTGETLQYADDRDNTPTPHRYEPNHTHGTQPTLTFTSRRTTHTTHA